MRKGRGSVRPLHAQENHADLLQKKLQQDARDDQHRDDLLQREEAEDASDESQGHERAVGNAVRRMHRCENSGSSCRRARLHRARASSRAAEKRLTQTPST